MTEQCCCEKPQDGTCCREDVLTALNRLHTAFPDQRTDIWVSIDQAYHGDTSPRYTVMVGEDYSYFVHYKRTPGEAVDVAIANHHPLTAQQKRQLEIQRLKTELAALEKQ